MDGTGYLDHIVQQNLREKPLEQFQASCGSSDVADSEDIRQSVLDGAVLADTVAWKRLRGWFLRGKGGEKHGLSKALLALLTITCAMGSSQVEMSSEDSAAASARGS